MEACESLEEVHLPADIAGCQAAGICGFVGQWERSTGGRFYCGGGQAPDPRPLPEYGAALQRTIKHQSTRPLGHDC